MLTHVIASGLRDWHAFWSPLKAWAEHHQDHSGNALQFFASLATVMGLPILALLIVATLVFLVSDRMDANRQRAQRRRAIMLGLEAELRGTRDSVSREVMASGPEGTGVWTTLPHTSIEQALIEAGLLGLTPEQIVGLHELRLRILKTNTLVSAKLVAPRIASGNGAESPGAGGDCLSRETRDQLEAITGLCNHLLAHLHAR